MCASQLIAAVLRAERPNRRRATMQLPEAAIAITLALGASGPETQCSLVWATNCASQADVIVVQRRPGPPRRGSTTTLPHSIGRMETEYEH